MSDILKVRQEIDHLDKEILKLLNLRARQVMEAGRIKQANGQPIFSPVRHVQIWRNLERENHGPLSEQAVKYLFGEIVAACINIINPMKVALLGPKGSFCHQAAMHYFGASCEYAPLTSIVDVFAEVERGHCQVGMVPVENSGESETDSTLDQFFSSGLSICGEAFTSQKLMLFSTSDDLSHLTDIYGNPLTLSLCRGWLSRNLPYARLHERAGVDAAIDSILDKPQAGAIGSELAARLSRLNVLASDINDQDQNSTRFLVLGKQGSPATGEDKTSILFNMTHEPGFLYKALSFLQGLNLTRVESRPTLNASWNYSLFVDLLGHRNDENVTRALEGLSEYAGGFKILGSYPRG